MPTPFAPTTSLWVAVSIDISPSTIPRSVAPRTWLPRTSTAAECVTIPSRTPAIVQPVTMLIGRPIEYETSTPCTHGPPGSAIEQPSIITPASRTWIASIDARTTRTSSSITCDAWATSMPFSPPITMTSRSVTWLARIRIPPLTTPPTSVCA